MRGFLLHILMLCAVLLSGCRKDSSVDATSESLQMELSTLSATRTDGRLWVEGDTVGLAMMSYGVLTKDDNLYYSAVNAGSLSAFLPNVAYCYPESGKASFMAYYPYDATCTSIRDITIDVTDLKNGFLVSDATECLYEDLLTLEFEPLLSKIEIHVVSAAGYDSSMLSSAAIMVSGLSTTGSYDLLTSTFTLDDSEDLSLSDNDDYVYTGSIIPQSSDSATLTLSFASGATYSYDLDVSTIDSGMVYSYSATVSDSGVEFESLSITPWGDGGDQTSTASRPIPEGYTPIYTADDYRTYFYYDENRTVTSGQYILMADIDLGSDWTMVSDTSQDFVFDGNGYTITFEPSDTWCSMPIGIGSYYSNSLFGENNGVIQNLIVEGSVYFNDASSNDPYYEYSGLVCTNNSGGIIRNCITNIRLVGDINYNMYVGGVAMKSYGEIYNCANWGYFNLPSLYVEAGGVVYENEGYVKNVYNAGNFSAISYWGGNGGTPYCIFTTDRYNQTNAIDNQDDSSANNVQCLSDNYMMSEAFVTTLNDGAAAVVAELDDVDALPSWVYNEGGYPTLDFSIAAASTDTELEEGDGSEESPYLLDSADDFATLSAEVAAGDTKQGIYYVVSKSLTLMTLLTEWVPIGTAQYHFHGHVSSLNGSNNPMEIELNTVTSRSRVNGLFGYVGSNATIDGIEVSGEVVGNYYVAGLATHNYGAISNCINNATVYTQGAYTVMGGVVAVNYSGASVINCRNEGMVKEEGAYVTIGTVVGENYGTCSGLTSTCVPYVYGYKTLSGTTIGATK